ncbi:RNA polymerase sigma-70 factor, ECF subfamily [Sinomicrobium oceani]|uniref:RNA polymerase sigma-70 factor, ECF subfamily n=1 Tax=Sinomicrobium oceani TaxID=1150368 RepID=A0A1K1M515_9FLAO|nr:RNA polymerase sigma-70 factor [Sinomicrobium oceani]SFW18237.1 RNA polymerase sigma-70 factor, ECF subfamily [Sinomicrobium oceani]
MEYFSGNETACISEIRSGNETAYRSVYLYFYERLCVYVLNFTGDREIAEDIVQEVFLKLWNNRKKLRPDGSLGGYLYRLTYNEYVNIYRQNLKQHRELELLRLKSLYELLHEEDEAFQEKVKQVTKIIEGLPPRCREIFILNKQQGLRHKEIAAQLDISVKTVENQVAKAMSLLRKKIADETAVLLVLLGYNGTVGRAGFGTLRAEPEHSAASVCLKNGR